VLKVHNNNPKPYNSTIVRLTHELGGHVDQVKIT
jgi:hypothetical protein